MKPLAASVMLGVAGLLVAALFAAAALTNGEPPLISPLFVAGSTNLGFTSFSSAPIVYLDGKQGHSQRLKPGVYQTRPYAIILIVPDSGLDDHCIAEPGDAGSKMPVINPKLRTVPVLPRP